MRQGPILVALSLAACGGVEDAEDVAAAAAGLTVAGTVTNTDGRVAGAFVAALDADGRRVQSTRTAADGTYRLTLGARPSTLEIKTYGHVPRTFHAPALRALGGQRYGFDVNVGPPLGADSTGETLSFQVLRADNDVRVAPQIAWGNGGSLEAPLDNVADLVVGPRHRAFTTMLPLGARGVSVEGAVLVRRDHLEVRFTRELNQHNLGSAYLAAMIDQIAATVSHGYSEDGLPVRIRVACAGCAGGFEPLRDGVVGAAGPSGSYEVNVPHPAGAFSDIYGHRYANHMAQAKALRIATGYSDGTNRPDRAVTRAELAAMLVSALGLPLVNPSVPSYTDVPRSFWAYRSIETARLHGIIASASTFAPTGTVTRAELASFLVNAARWPLASPTGPSFRDVSSAYWAYRKIETAHGWCRAVDRVGDDFGLFAPARAATRAEAIAGAVRMTQCLVGNEPK